MKQVLLVLGVLLSVSSYSQVNILKVKDDMTDKISYKVSSLFVGG